MRFTVFMYRGGDSLVDTIGVVGGGVWGDCLVDPSFAQSL